MIPDPDGDPLTLVAHLVGGGSLPDWLGFDGVAFAGQPPADFNGSLDLLVTASNDAGSASQDFRITVSPVNDAPVVLAPLGAHIVPEDAAFAFAVPVGTFGDVDGDALTLSATRADGTPLPAWLGRSSGL